MARQPSGSPVLEALLEQYEYDAHPDVRGRRHLQPRVPGRDRHRQAHQGAARARAQRRAPSASRSALARRWDAVERARARPRCEPAPAAATGRCARSRGLARARGQLDELIPAWGAGDARARAPRSCRRRAREGAAAVYFPACVNRIFGNPRERARRAGARRRRWCAVSARAGRPLWIPPDVAGPLLRDAVELEGLPRSGQEQMARRIAAALLRWTDGGRAAGRARRELVHARPAREDCAGTLAEDERERFEQVAVIDSIAWVHDRLLAALEVERQARPRSRCTRPARPSTSASRSKLRAVAEALAEEVLVPRRDAAAAGWPATAACCTPSCPPRRSRAARAELARLAPERLPVQQPHLRDRPAGGHRAPLRLVRGAARAPHARRAGPHAGGGHPRLGSGGDAKIARPSPWGLARDGVRLPRAGAQAPAATAVRLRRRGRLRRGDDARERVRPRARAAAPARDARRLGARAGDRGARPAALLPGRARTRRPGGDDGHPRRGPGRAGGRARRHPVRRVDGVDLPDRGGRGAPPRGRRGFSST